jgi:hypothetical protein
MFNVDKRTGNITQLQNVGGTFINARGAVVYRSFNENPQLDLSMLNSAEDKIVYNVLSVGLLDGVRNPILTVDNNGQAKCYRLPESLLPWVKTTISYVNTGALSLPRRVEFSFINGNYTARYI